MGNGEISEWKWLSLVGEGVNSWAAAQFDPSISLNKIKLCETFSHRVKTDLLRGERNVT